MNKKNEQPLLPKIGNDIYVETILHLSHGRDDVFGGMAKVTLVETEIINNELIHFISVDAIPGRFNWEQYLAPMQGALRKKFGQNRAHPDPDDRPQFNESW